MAVATARRRVPCGVPFNRQIDTITIADEDAISDSGMEVGNLFAQCGIENVILLGVHTNMCVVGRPFGLGTSFASARTSC